MESLTESLVVESRKLLDEVEELGGMTRAVEQGFPKQRIEEAAAIRQAKIDQGEEVIVGVNKYQTDESEQIEVREVDNTEVRNNQIQRLEQIRKSRDNTKVQDALKTLEDRALTGRGTFWKQASKRSVQEQRLEKYPMPWKNIGAVTMHQPVQFLEFMPRVIQVMTKLRKSGDKSKILLKK